MLPSAVLPSQAAVQGRRMEALAPGWPLLGGSSSVGRRTGDGWDLPDVAVPLAVLAWYSASILCRSSRMGASFCQAAIYCSYWAVAGLPLSWIHPVKRKPSVVASSISCQWRIRRIHSGLCRCEGSLNVISSGQASVGNQWRMSEPAFPHGTDVDWELEQAAGSHQQT